MKAAVLLALVSFLGLFGKVVFVKRLLFMSLFVVSRFRFSSLITPAFGTGGEGGLSERVF